MLRILGNDAFRTSKLKHKNIKVDFTTVKSFDEYKNAMANMFPTGVTFTTAAVTFKKDDAHGNAVSVGTGNYQNPESIPKIWTTGYIPMPSRIETRVYYYDVSSPPYCYGCLQIETESTSGLVWAFIDSSANTADRPIIKLNNANTTIYSDSSVIDKELAFDLPKDLDRCISPTDKQCRLSFRNVSKYSAHNGSGATYAVGPLYIEYLRIIY